MSFKHRLITLTRREYLPMAGSGAMWALVLAAVGPADLWRLLAALTLIRAVQLLTRMPTLTALRRRTRAPSKVVRKSAKRARLIQLGSLIAGILVMTVVLAGVAATGQQRWAMLVALMSVGYPARNVLQSEARTNERIFRIVVQWFGAAMLVPAHLLEWGPGEIAYMIGLREWVAGLASLIWKHSEKAGSAQNDAPLTAAEVAAVTVLRARRAFTYRVSNALLTLFLPGAGFLARTGRGMNLHHRLEKMLPRYRPGFIAAAAVPTLAASAIIIWFPRPILLLSATMLARIGAAAGSVLVWWPYLEHVTYDDDDEDED